MYGGNGADTLYVGASARLSTAGRATTACCCRATPTRRSSVGGSPTQFTDCGSARPGADLGQAPSLLRVARALARLGVPIVAELVLRAASYELLSDCDLARRRCLAGDRPQRILGTKRADVIRGGDGDDFLEGAGGSDRLYGGGDDDSLFGRTGNDSLAGGNGDDELEGGRGDDVLRGGRGRDQLNGGFGHDRLLGGPGADTIRAVGGGTDVIDCGDGTDRVEKDSRDRSRNARSCSQGRPRTRARLCAWRKRPVQPPGERAREREVDGQRRRAAPIEARRARTIARCATVTGSSASRMLCERNPRSARAGTARRRRRRARRPRRAAVRPAGEADQEDHDPGPPCRSR